MTFREKLKLEHPRCIDPVCSGGCMMCPSFYGYEPVDTPKPCKGVNVDDSTCRKCWDREIPEENTEETPVEAPTTIKDSGARREFESGAVRDIQEGKGRCDLLPLDVVAEVMGCGGDEILTLISAFKKTGDPTYLRHVLQEAITVLIYHNMADMLLEVSIHFENGAKKYGEYNWQKGIPVHCYIDSAVRHYLKYLRGDDDEYHDRAFVWNILCCIWTCKHKPELNEYKKVDVQ